MDSKKFLLNAKIKLYLKIYIKVWDDFYYIEEISLNVFV